ncbi:restriction endonuclease [Pseudanabaena minima]|uniref:restriction endonuclease n=1 Tax=Pseudanabaena minima TaxID=890415 RepID=UPI003DA7F3B1
MLRKDGKKLEELVAEIEKIVASSGKTVEVNKRFYDDQGVQVAEFDIFITFSSDLGDHKWLIECRDRPSQGAVSGSWIEQLIGRKFLHQLDRVIAVSTTDFSPGAKLWAEEGNIELRTVNQVETPESWLCNAVTFLNRTGIFNNCKVNLLNRGFEQHYIDNIVENMPSNPDEILISFEKIDARLLPRELFQNLCFDDKNAIYKNIAPGTSKSIHITCPPDLEITGLMFIEFDNFKVPLENIEFSGEARIEMNTVPFDKIEIYKHSKEEGFIGQRMTCLFETDQEKMKFQFYDVQVEDGRQIAIKTDKESKN